MRGSIIVLRRAFLRAVEKGNEEEFRAASSGTEQEWVEVMERLERWAKARDYRAGPAAQGAERAQGEEACREVGGSGPSSAAFGLAELDGAQVEVECFLDA